jgi:HlyD family secretion protein
MPSKMPFTSHKVSPVLACLAALALLVGPAAAATAEQPAGGKTIQLSGTLAAYEQVDLCTKLTGFVKNVYVDLGDRVKRGDVLAELDASELVQEVKLHQALVAQAKAGIEQAKQSVAAHAAAVDVAKANVFENDVGVLLARIRIDLARTRYERLVKLMANGSVDKQTMEDSRFEVEKAEAGVKQSQAKLKAAQALVEEAVAKRDKAKVDVLAAEAGLLAAEAGLTRVDVLRQYAQIRAPFDGVVLRRAVDAGTLAVLPTGNQAKALFTVARIDQVRVVCQVAETDVAQLAMGAPAIVRIGAFKGEEFKAKVTRIAAALDAKTHTLRLEIDLPNPQGRLLPGMSATVVLAPQAKE